MARGKSSRGRQSGGGSKGKYRSAISGRYVTAKHGKRSPRTTVKESASKGVSSKGRRHRLAITGRYVTEATAKRHPNTTVTEK